MESSMLKIPSTKSQLCIALFCINTLVIIGILYSEYLLVLPASTTSHESESISLRRNVNMNKTFNKTENLKEITDNRPNFCNSTRELLLLGIVFSTSGNGQLRNILRRTWVSDLARGSGTAVVFFVGKTQDVPVDDMLVREGKIHNDMVLVDFAEDFFNGTFKTIIALKWVNVHCPKVHYILKAEENDFINVGQLLQFLTEEEPDESAIIAQFATKLPLTAGVSTGTDNFLQVIGSAFVIGGNVVAKIVQNCPIMPNFTMDDVFVTGICADKLQINWVMNARFLSFPISPSKRTHCGIFSVICISGIPVTMVETLWKKVNDFEAHIRCLAHQPIMS